MLPVQPNLPADQRQLLKLYQTLGESDRHALLSYAEFLQQRGRPATAEAGAALAEPKYLPRPEKESVVAAMRRLSESYYMIDRSQLLDQASSLMGAHMLQGHSAERVIDELESLFSEAYEKLALASRGEG